MYTDGFGPMMDGFDQVPLGDIAAVKRAVGPETAGILIEPLQGEGGVRTVEPAFARAARNIPNIDVLPVQGINVYDILRRKTLVLTKAALDALEARFK